MLNEARTELNRGWPSHVTIGVSIGFVAGAPVVWISATCDGFLGSLMIPIVPVALILLSYIGVVVRQVAYILQRREDRSPLRGMPLSMLMAIGCFLAVAIIGSWTVAESGYSSHSLSDGGIRRIFQRHRAALADFEASWITSLSDHDARAMIDDISQRIGCCARPSWNTIGGTVHFELANGELITDRWSKGFSLVPTIAEGTSGWTPRDDQKLGGRWFIYSEET